MAITMGIYTATSNGTSMAITGALLCAPVWFGKIPKEICVEDTRSPG